MMSKFIEIDGQKIGDSYPTYFCIEIGINHNGQLDKAKALIDVAVAANANAVKFQKRDLNSLFRKEDLIDTGKYGQGFSTTVDWLKKIDVNDDFYFEINDYCREKGITFLCTPFDIKSARFLENEIGVSAYKIGSPCFTDLLLLEEIATYEKPMILSTGMTTLDEVDTVVNYLLRNECKIALMHCVSNYPVEFENVYLKFIDYYKEQYNVPVGYSAHQEGIIVPVVAATRGANIIELHLTLRRSEVGPDHASSLEPQGVSRLIKYVRHCEKTLKDLPETKINSGEIMNLETLGKSIISKVDIKAGERITKDKLTTKSPGLFLSPLQLEKIIFSKAKIDIPTDTFLAFEMIE